MYSPRKNGGGRDIKYDAYLPHAEESQPLARRWHPLPKTDRSILWGIWSSYTSPLPGPCLLITQARRCHSRVLGDTEEEHTAALPIRAPMKGGARPHPSVGPLFPIRIGPPSSVPVFPSPCSFPGPLQTFQGPSHDASPPWRALCAETWNAWRNVYPTNCSGTSSELSPRLCKLRGWGPWTDK